MAAQRVRKASWNCHRIPHSARSTALSVPYFHRLGMHERAPRGLHRASQPEVRCTHSFQKIYRIYAALSSPTVRPHHAAALTCLCRHYAAQSGCSAVSTVY